MRMDNDYWDARMLLAQMLYDDMTRASSLLWLLEFSNRMKGALER